MSKLIPKSDQIVTPAWDLLSVTSMLMVHKSYIYVFIRVGLFVNRCRLEVLQSHNSSENVTVKDWTLCPTNQFYFTQTIPLLEI